MLSLLSQRWLRREKGFHGVGDLICTFFIHASHLEQIIDPQPKIQWLILAINLWQRSVTSEPPRVSPNVVAASWSTLTNVPYTLNLWMPWLHLYWMVTWSHFVRRWKQVRQLHEHSNQNKASEQSYPRLVWKKCFKVSLTTIFSTNFRECPACVSSSIIRSVVS